MPLRRTLGLLASTVLLAAAAGETADYETPASRAVSAVLPPLLAKGPSHTVREPVVADGYMYHYQINSSSGPFDVIGTGALRKLVHELWAIGELQKISGSEAFVKALGTQALKPVEFAKNVLTTPGETLSGVPKGIGRLFSNSSTAVNNTPDPSQEIRTKELLQVGSFKREYAGRFNVDPYSSNKVLQEELDKLAKASAYGLWTASIGTMPIGGTAGAVLTATSLGQSFNDVINNEPPARIRVINEQKLTEMGIGADLAMRYLDHPQYTPRDDLIFVEALHKLTGATGRDRYLEKALKAEDEVEAHFFVNTAQILRGYHEKRSPITGITMFEALTVAQTKAGPAVIPFPLDYGVWTRNADVLSQHLKTAYKAPGFNGRFEFWVTGTLSPAAKKNLKARRFTVVEQAGSQIEIID